MVYDPRPVREGENILSALRSVCVPALTACFLPQILLVTNDAANLKLAKSEGLTAMTMREYVKSLRAEFPLLSDLLAASAESDASIAAGGTPGGAAPAAPSGGPTHFYPTHIPMSKIQEGLRAGTLFSGAIRLNRDCWFEGTVGTELPNGDFQSISISGREAVNRATEVAHARCMFPRVLFPNLHICRVTLLLLSCCLAVTRQALARS